MDSMPARRLLVMAGFIVVSPFGCNAGPSRPPPVILRDGPAALFVASGRAPARTTAGVRALRMAVWLPCSASRARTPDARLRIFASVLFYALTTIALFMLRSRRPDVPRPVKAFGYPIIPALYVVSLVALMVVLLIRKPEFTWPGLIIVALGIPVYLVWRRGAAARTG